MKNIFNLSMLCLALLAVACDKPDVEIVEQNNSYKLDPNAIYVDMPEKFGYNTFNLIRNESGAEVVLYASEEDGKIELPVTTDISLTFKLKRGLKQAAKFVFSPDEELMKLYTGVKEGFKPFPENAFSDMEFTVPPGVTSYTTKIKLQKTAELNGKSGFLSAYRLKLLSEDKDAEIKVSLKTEALYIKLKLSSLKNGTNISLAEKIGKGSRQLPSNQITPKSDYQTGRLHYLLDGQKFFWSSNWWIPGGGTETLELGFAKQKVGGIVFYTYGRARKRIRSVQVSVSEDDGATYFDQGTVTPQEKDTVIIVFNKPVEIDKIKFSNFVSWNSSSSDSFVDIHEIEVFSTITDDSGDDGSEDDDPENDEAGDDDSEDGDDDSEDDESGDDDSEDDDPEA
ncbi:hypothetical protein ACTMKN_04645 [Bacteroides pyogenes]|uniref:DUF1735 domain-containing protein n=1 Tax=Bacteroides pyogenes TaxID=310300 RepID=A0A5D3EGF5_9BACE|nr:hypothetical protein [Bacteroides pyogenes]TYK34135.1 hypothetical protein FNJ59_13780 [Bacteroides pyogenes]TYK34154.1 hypothetical protein FNJ60_05300 [Bacteroides pyogenes]TYK50126.1 hypothetical protein FNG97_04705 [Bacteroides pyogenes]